MKTKKCNCCNKIKSLDEFHKDKQLSHGVKNYCKECILEKRKHFKENFINTPDNIKCKTCFEIKPNSDFDKDSSVTIGRKSNCKKCINKMNKQRISTWKGLVRKKVVESWSSHSNKNSENKLSIEEGMLLLTNQNYKCNHCKHVLDSESGTIYKKNGWIASLDRIDTDIIGYKNNSQWLCMSCNNGKNTMNNEEHLNKFKIRDDEIDLLKSEIQLLKLEIFNTKKDQRLNGSG